MTADDAGYNIHNENCLTTMGGMPDNSVDCVITSPPYNMNLRIRNGKYCSRQVIKEEFSTKYEEFSDNIPIDDFYALHKTILTELVRVSKLTFYVIQLVTGSKRAFFKLIGDFNEEIKDIIIWDKGNPQPAMSVGVLNRQSEMIIVLEKNGISRKFQKSSFKRGTLNDVWKIKRGKVLFPSLGATFPEELVKKIIDNFTEEGDLIYDPFSGTGTTAKVSLENNRRFVGSEISKRYCDISHQRIGISLPILKQENKVAVEGVEPPPPLH